MSKAVKGCFVSWSQRLSEQRETGCEDSCGFDWTPFESQPSSFDLILRQRKVRKEGRVCSQIFKYCWGHRFPEDGTVWSLQFSSIAWQRCCPLLHVSINTQFKDLRFPRCFDLWLPRYCWVSPDSQTDVRTPSICERAPRHWRCRHRLGSWCLAFFHQPWPENTSACQEQFVVTHASLAPCPSACR